MLRERMIGEHYLDFDHNAHCFGVRPAFLPINNEIKEQIREEQMEYMKEVYKNIFFQAFKCEKDIFEGCSKDLSINVKITAKKNNLFCKFFGFIS